MDIGSMSIEQLESLAYKTMKGIESEKENLKLIETVIGIRKTDIARAEASIRNGVEKETV